MLEKTPIADLYRQSNEQSEQLDPAFVSRLSRRVKWLSLQVAFWRRPVRDANCEFVDWIRSQGAFDLRLSDRTPSPPHLTFANHQGPGEGSKGLGGLETIFSYLMDPPKTRIVLKDDLVHYPEGWEWLDDVPRALKQRVRAGVMRKLNPIVFTRPDHSLDRKVVCERIREERRRVVKHACELVNSGSCPTVKIYVEGTRSSTGKILPVMRELCEVVISDYVYPRLQSGQSPEMALQIADTLQTFPDGLSSSVPAYRRPMTIETAPYPLSASLIEDVGNWNGREEELRGLGNRFKKDLEQRMEERLRSILEGSPYR